MAIKKTEPKQNNDIDLEDLILQTEQKITNNEYYEDVTIHYRDLNVHVRIKPISQAKFTKIVEKTKNKSDAQINTLLIQECVINKKDNSHFTIEQIEKLFTGGLASSLAWKCSEISGITDVASEYQNMKNF